MQLDKSIVLPAFFPKSISSRNELLRAIAMANYSGVNTVEFYYSGERDECIKKEIEDHGLNSVYLGAMAIKLQQINPSYMEDKERRRAVERLKQVIDTAYYYGSHTLLINSGKRPAKKEDNKAAYQALVKSLFELLTYAEERATDYLLDITLEPGDTDLDFCGLIGSTELSIKIVEEIREKYSNFYLTLDTSHLLQLGEKPLKAIKMAKEYCKHIHLANCVINSKESKYYGDKHPNFGVASGELGYEEIKLIYEEIIEKYKDQEELLLGVEIIAQAGCEMTLLERVRQQMEWFFN